MDLDLVWDPDRVCDNDRDSCFDSSFKSLLLLNSFKVLHEGTKGREALFAQIRSF